jgi:protein-S-isoprenylcysteine O-methyltransferase Ste14
MSDLTTLRQVVFWSVCGMWLAFGAAYLLRKHPPRAATVKTTPGLIPGLVLQGAGLTLIWVFNRPQWRPFVKMPAALEIVLNLLVLVLMAASVVFMHWAIRVLGKQWSYRAQLVEGHRLVTEGPYGIVRNPIYSGLLGMLVANGIAWSRWEALLAAVAVYLAGTAIRVRSEETLLRGAFGAEFEEYAQRVPAVIPGIW